MSIIDVPLSDLVLDSQVAADRTWRQLFSEHRLTAVHLMRAVT